MAVLENQEATALRSLRQFGKARPAPAVRCELCGGAAGDPHEHVVLPKDRAILCTCTPCAVVHGHGPGANYRRVPRTVSRLVDPVMSDAQWDALAVPIDLVFFFRNSQAGRVVAIYPSAAGPVESLLGLEAWDSIVRANPALERMEPDVEALLVHRKRVDPRYLIAPIDRCYELVGLIRKHWRGLSGGTAVWREVEAFFDRLEEQSTPLASAHA